VHLVGGHDAFVRDDVPIFGFVRVDRAAGRAAADALFAADAKIELVVGLLPIWRSAEPFDLFLRIGARANAQGGLEETAWQALRCPRKIVNAMPTLARLDDARHRIHPQLFERVTTNAGTRSN
jgi:hypothetical protein